MSSRGSRTPRRNPDRGLGAGPGITVDTGDICGGEFRFTVSILPGTEAVVWQNTSVGDKIQLKKVISQGLPAIEVQKDPSNFVIGLAPASQTYLLKCLDQGWKYKGSIIEKKGTSNSPDLLVKIKGEK
jgi:hypothetical protein